MSFVVEKYRFLKNLEKSRAKYGENSNVALRDVTYSKKHYPKKEHSFPELLNKNFPVPEVHWKYVEKVKPIATYAISEQERLKLALRNAAHEKTIFDD